MPAQTTIRTAVLGFGTSGRVFHTPFLAADPSYEISAIVTGDAGRREQAAAEYPHARLLRSADEVFSQADQYDLVVVGTPSGTHEEMAARALDAGLHVVVDKPFALSSAGGRCLVDQAAGAGRVLTVFQNRRWDGDFLTLRRLVADGVLGEVHRFESRFEWWKPDQGMTDVSWKTTSARSQGGGLIYDLGTHLIDQALQLFGPVREDAGAVYAELDTRRHRVSAEDDAFVALHHVSGVRSHLWMSAVAPVPAPRFHVSGSVAGYTSWGLDPQEPQLKGGMRPGDDGFATTPASRWGVLGTGDERHPVATLDGDYAEFYRRLAAAITTGAPVPVDPAGPLEVLRIIDTIERINN
jgi:predicted dehydrogenase